MNIININWKDRHINISRWFDFPIKDNHTLLWLYIFTLCIIYIMWASAHCTIFYSNPTLIIVSMQFHYCTANKPGTRAYFYSCTIRLCGFYLFLHQTHTWVESALCNQTMCLALQLVATVAWTYWKLQPTIHFIVCFDELTFRNWTSIWKQVSVLSLFTSLLSQIFRSFSHWMKTGSVIFYNQRYTMFSMKIIHVELNKLIKSIMLGN